MKNFSKKILRIFYYLIAVVIVCVAAFSLWLYKGTLTGFKVKIFQIMPFPLAIVGNRPITMKDYLLRDTVAQKLLDEQALAKNSRQAIVNELIFETQLKELAERYGVSVSEKQLDAQYSLETNAEKLTQGRNFSGQLSSYGLNEDTFKNQVIKPVLLLENFNLWFNSQVGLNQDSYNQADALLTQINNGQDMAALASKFSQNDNEKSTGGDLGFLNIADLAMPLRGPVSAMNMGENKIIAGSDGLHVIRLEGKSGNLLHLREIFLSTGDFEAWLNEQIKSIKVYKLINI